MVEETEIKIKGGTFKIMWCVVEIVNGMKIWSGSCPHCGEWNTHSPCEGHRRSHCHCEESGYYLKLTEEI